MQLFLRVLQIGVRGLCHPAERADEVVFGIGVPGVVFACAFRFIAEQVGHLRIAGAPGPLAPRGMGDRQARFRLLTTTVPLQSAVEAPAGKCVRFVINS